MKLAAVEYTPTAGKAFMNIQRGMVFQFDLDPTVDKLSDPVFHRGSKDFRDHRQYGRRDWLVVSCDKSNDSSPTCTIVPITGSAEKSTIPTHVQFTHGRMTLTVLCEHPQTVNILQLGEFRYILKPFIMEKVSEALMIHLGIDKKLLYIDEPVKNAFDKIEEIVSGIISAKVKEAVAEIEKARVPETDIQDAVLRLGQGLEDLLGSVITMPEPAPEVKASEPASEVKIPEPVPKVEEDPKSDVENPEQETLKSEKVEISRPETTKQKKSEADRKSSKTPKVDRSKDREEEPVTVKSEQPPAVSSVHRGAEKSREQRKNRKWDMTTTLQFLDDVEILPPTECLKKWGLKDMKALYSLKYSLRSKAEKFNSKKK